MVMITRENHLLHIPFRFGYVLVCLLVEECKTTMCWFLMCCSSMHCNCYVLTMACLVVLL
jgi:hypothetical protein